MVYYEDSLREAGRRIVQRIEYFCDFHQNFGRLVNGELKAAVAGLVDDDAVLFKEKINFKMPGGAGFEPHQDQQAAGPPTRRCSSPPWRRSTPATLANGCLEMARGPKARGLVGREWEPLSEAELAGFALEPVPTEPGDVLFFDSYAPHASKANQTEDARRIPLSHLQPGQRRRSPPPLLRRQARELSARHRASRRGDVSLPRVIAPALASSADGHAAIEAIGRLPSVPR